MSGLALRSVTHRYAGAETDAVREVTLAVPVGTTTSVMGPSGSGKSTLLRVAAGLERPTAGRVEVGGHDVTDLPTERRDLTVMFQHPLLFDHLDVGDNVAFGPRVAGASRREARRRAARYLDLVHLDGVAGRRVSSLSGGQQQRVALARALATETGLLLLDEPFTALDRELRTQMHDLLAEVCASLAPTVLLVTHDIDEAGLAASTAVLVDGVVHQQAPSPLLHTEPATLAVARLAGGFTEVSGRADGGVHRSGWGDVPLAPRCRIDGDAVLLLRREQLDLHSEEPGGDTVATAGPGLRGRVTRVRPAGPRRVVTVTAADGATADVELAPGAALPATDRVRVGLRPGATGWAVPPAAPR